MQLLETVRPGDAEVAADLSERFEAASAEQRLRAAIGEFFPGRIALVSSFGADAAVLLHMVADIDPATPVVFVDTGMLFPETIAYREHLAATLGLTNVATEHPEPADLALDDPEAFLWARDPNRCCRVRKVLPLARALDRYDAWISGRKRFQARTREHLPVFEVEGRRTKVNPLVDWSAPDIRAYFAMHDLPRHPLVAKNYLSIGCMPCTSAVRPGEDARSGRWRGKAKVECGIHGDFAEQGAGI